MGCDMSRNVLVFFPFSWTLTSWQWQCSFTEFLNADAKTDLQTAKYHNWISLNSSQMLRRIFTKHERGNNSQPQTYPRQLAIRHSSPKGIQASSSRSCDNNTGIWTYHLVTIKIASPVSSSIYWNAFSTQHIAFLSSQFETC